MPNVKTECIKPHPILRPFIRCFAMRTIDNGDAELLKPMIADHEMTMSFFLHSRLFGFGSYNANPVPYTIKNQSLAECVFTGVLTNTKGFVIFKGVTTILNIHFTPTGFYHIFNISPRILVNKLGDNEDVLSCEISLLHEQMHYAKNLFECIKMLEGFLIKKLNSQHPKYKNVSIKGAAALLLQANGLYSIKKLAYESNMTLQTFEVNFKEQVGVVPKYYSRILKINTAINTKLYQPSKSWTDIAHASGYFDQTHFIKDFKQFTDLSPLRFMQQINMPIEDFE